jgi:molybdopterin-guanine dinucleotide biosynthesis protein A
MLHSQLLGQMLQLVSRNDGCSKCNPREYPIVIYLDESHGIGPLDGITSALKNLKNAAVIIIYVCVNNISYS